MKDRPRPAAPGGRLLLFLDYDGTLVPIRKTPELAVLPPSHRRILERLSQRACLGIVSGRCLADIRRQVAVPGAAYIGNHGFEIAYRGRSWVHPEAEKKREELQKVLDRIRRRMAKKPGLIVEDKGVTASLHFRRLAPAEIPDLYEIVLQEVRRRERDLVVTEGKKVFEIRPRVDWDKGRGVLELCRWLRFNGRDLRIYAGDDRTDEDAFKALRRSGLTLLVGRARPTKAAYRLANIDAVWKLLRALLAILSSESPCSARGSAS